MKAFLCAVMLAGLALSGGCQSGGGLFTQTPIVTTNYVALPSVTNTVVVGTNVTVTITPPVTLTNYSTNVVYAVNPAVTTGLQIAQKANEVLNPTPTAPLINLGLGAIAAGLAWFARFKSNKAAASQALLKTVIQGVEASGNPDVKTAIQRQSVANGLSADLHNAVQDTVG